MSGSRCNAETSRTTWSGKSSPRRSSASGCARGESFCSRESPWERRQRCILQVLEGSAVKITYDRRTDTLSVVLKDGVAVAESDEDKPGVILDYDAAGDLVSLEILDASRRVTEAGRVEYQTTG